MQWDLVWQLYRTLKGLPCDVWQRKVLDIHIDEVSGALPMHASPWPYGLLWYPLE
jgi:hypothetical protein